MPAPTATTTRDGELRKKERTRRDLIGAAIDAIASEGEAFTVLDVTRRARVSNGTFYNHFADREALIDAVVAEVVGAFTTTSAEVVELDDPARRFATITAMLFDQAAASPELATVLLRVETLTDTDGGSSDPLAHLRRDLEHGVALGRFDREPTEAVVDLASGTMLRAVRRIATVGADDRYRREVIALMLRTLGVESAEAEQVSAQAVEAAPGFGRVLRDTDR